MGHLFKICEDVLDEFFADDFLEIVFVREIKLIDLISLLKMPLFELQEVTVIPGKDGYFTIWAIDFVDNAHICFGIECKTLRGNYKPENCNRIFLFWV